MNRFSSLALLLLTLACTPQAGVLRESQPGIILGGELSNSCASSREYMDSLGVWDSLRDAGLNTVLCPVYWELIEPEEGKFDFSSVDYLLDRAGKHRLNLILLWFGSWKNSISSYVPSWVKLSFGSRFELARLPDGSTQEILSAFDSAAMEADSRAFAALMKHLKQKDGRRRRVIMIQVENEIGFLGAAREYGEKASAAWSEEGAEDGDILAEERFQAKYYARYANAVAAAGKAEYDIPMFVNAALDSRGRKPGEYPSGGPLGHLFEIWKTEAPAIDLLCPDIYDPPFRDWASRYDRPGNRLFIPEIRQDAGNGAQALYALGRHKAMGFSPFAIESNPGCVKDAYLLLRGFSSLIATKQAEGKVYGVLLDKDHPTDTVSIRGVDFICRHDGSLRWSPVHGDLSSWGEGALLIMDLDEDGLLFLGTSALAEMRPSDGKGHVGILSLEEVKDQSLRRVRRLNGDESHQGRHLRIPYGEFSAQLLKTYHFD